VERAPERLTVTVPWQVTGSSGRGRSLAPYVNGLAIAVLVAAGVAAAFARRRRDRVEPPPLPDPVAESVR
jgi:hypothetical protein